MKLLIKSIEPGWTTEYCNENWELHRLDGPAIEWDTGRKAWFQKGKRHRIDGPAILYPNGYKQYWIDGKEVEPFQ